MMLMVVGYDTSCSRQLGVCFLNATQILKKQLNTSESWVSLHNLPPLYVSRSAGWFGGVRTRPKTSTSSRTICTRQVELSYTGHCRSFAPGIRTLCTAFGVHQEPHKEPFWCTPLAPEAFKHQKEFAQPCTRLMGGRCSLFSLKYLQHQ